jgi:hypothetical protein
MEAERTMRMHHMLWHTARNNWATFDQAAKDAFRAVHWDPPRPALDASGRPILDNNSGEDFFYMHRHMIEAVNKMLAQIGDPTYPRVEGWPHFPSPDDPDYPVPPTYHIGSTQDDQSLATVKSKDFFDTRFQPQAQHLEDPAFLKTITLGELGARVEFSVHNSAHMRWSAKPAEIRPDPSATDPEAVDPRFDNPSYDWLGDFYSSHVNSVFWKLHGWVDDRIDAWMQANNITQPYQWKGTWEGPMSMDHMHMHLEAAAAGEAPAELGDHLRGSEELLRVAAQAGPLASPFVQVELD